MSCWCRQAIGCHRSCDGDCADLPSATKESTVMGSSAVKQGIGGRTSACGDSLIVPEQLPELSRLASSGAYVVMCAADQTYKSPWSHFGMRVCVCVLC